MKFETVFTVLTSFALGAHAHFRLLYPEPRGQFVADRQPLFCGGYDEVTTNRTVFPLKDGFFRIRQGHPNWAASVLISTVPNPNNFDNFSIAGQSQFVHLWANETKTGNFCIPLDVEAANIPGAVDGANVTIQVVLAGGDGQLYQCADLTLSANATISAELQATCVNQTATETAYGSSGAAPSATGGAGSGGVFSQSEHLPVLVACGTGLLGAFVALAL